MLKTLISLHISGAKLVIFECNTKNIDAFVTIPTATDCLARFTAIFIRPHTDLSIEIPRWYNIFAPFLDIKLLLLP